MLFINPESLVNSKQYVREPVDNISTKINQINSKKVILTGGRGTGKSVILNGLEKNGINSLVPTIYTQFDPIISFSMYPNKVFTEEFFRHYYELCFSWKLLKFIESNYTFIYEIQFRDFEILLKQLSNELDENINSFEYRKGLLSKYLFPTEISSRILSRLKETLGVETFNLAIDRFDWTNGKSSFSQLVLSEFFDMFNKVIITVDGELDKSHKESLINRGYSFFKADYGFNPEVIKCIIRKRIELYNQSRSNPFGTDLMTDEVYERMVNKTDGNISMMIGATHNVIKLYDWYNSSVEILQLFDMAIEEQLETSNQLRLVNVPPKFYL